jgi:hypothetical protein
MSVLIIIPARAEAGGIARTVRSLRLQKPLEIVVIAPNQLAKFYPNVR